MSASLTAYPCANADISFLLFCLYVSFFISYRSLTSAAFEFLVDACRDLAHDSLMFSITGIRELFNLVLFLHTHQTASTRNHCKSQSIYGNASSSTTKVTSLWNCRMDAGTSGVTGPKKAFFTASALSFPEAISRIFFAFRMLPMPMVKA